MFWADFGGGLGLGGEGEEGEDAEAAGAQVGGGELGLPGRECWLLLWDCWPRAALHCVLLTILREVWPCASLSESLPPAARSAACSRRGWPAGCGRTRTLRLNAWHAPNVKATLTCCRACRSSARSAASLFPGLGGVRRSRAGRRPRAPRRRAGPGGAAGGGGPPGQPAAVRPV